MPELVGCTVDDALLSFAGHDVHHAVHHAGRLGLLHRPFGRPGRFP